MRVARIHTEITRRDVVLGGSALALASLTSFGLSGCLPADRFVGSRYRLLTDEQWRARLPEVSYRVLRHDATEAPQSSPVLHEHRRGLFVCRGCGLPMFRSEWKYDSGTGWPSFFQGMRENFRMTNDESLMIIRTAFQCGQCLGHAGHIFSDGPQPTGERSCTNGAAISFVPVKPTA